MDITIPRDEGGVGKMPQQPVAEGIPRTQGRAKGVQPFIVFSLHSAGVRVTAQGETLHLVPGLLWMGPMSLPKGNENQSGGVRPYP